MSIPSSPLLVIVLSSTTPLVSASKLMESELLSLIRFCRIVPWPTSIVIGFRAFSIVNPSILTLAPPDTINKSLSPPPLITVLETSLGFPVLINVEATIRSFAILIVPISLCVPALTRTVSPEPAALMAAPIVEKSSGTRIMFPVGGGAGGPAIPPSLPQADSKIAMPAVAK